MHVVIKQTSCSTSFSHQTRTWEGSYHDLLRTLASIAYRDAYGWGLRRGVEMLSWQHFIKIKGCQRKQTGKEMDEKKLSNQKEMGFLDKNGHIVFRSRLKFLKHVPRYSCRLSAERSKKLFCSRYVI